MSGAQKFIARHGLYTPEMMEAAERTKKIVDENDIELIRIVWPDQYGLLRGRALTRDAYFGALEDGNELSMGPFIFDPANAMVMNPFTPDGGFEIEGMAGAPSITMVPDPETFKILPWASKTALVFADLYKRDGQPFPLAPRTILRTALNKLHEHGYGMLAGIELEWYLTKILDNMLENGSVGSPGVRADAPRVAPVARGYSLLLVDNLDEIDDILLPIRESLTAMDLPLRSFDDEWAPSQVETTFDVLDAMKAADAVCLFKMAVKQTAKRNGHLASFMCTPALDGFYASGWHLHTSIVDAETGENLMVPQVGQPLSELGQHYVGGQLAHGEAASVFTTPTVNGYRRRRPFSLAPDRLTWGADNKAAMMRVISSPGSKASHVENRVGESAANPYLYIASQVAAGLDGIVNKTSPGPLSQDPYASDSPQLPTTLEEAVDALEADQFFRREFGDAFINYMVQMKRSEIQRYNAWLEENPNRDADVNGVTDWEHREYFELF